MFYKHIILSVLQSTININVIIPVLWEKAINNPPPAGSLHAIAQKLGQLL